MLAELWRQYKYEGSNDAREELILECLPMVKAMAQRFALYAFPCCDSDDLTSTGVIGLLDALEKYDPAMQTSFISYARHRVRGAILDEVRRIQWAPRSIQEKIQNLKRTYTQLEQTLAREPTEAELAKALQMGIREFRRMLIQIGPFTLLTLGQKIAARGENTDSHEVSIEDPDATDPLDEAMSNEIKSLLASAIRKLPEREVTVITLYYYEEVTMKEIGEILSLTESRICQIHASALLHLFHALSPKGTGRDKEKIRGQASQKTVPLGNGQISIR